MTETLAALVPMKGYSERVPNKNTRDFNGRPLFHWIVATLEATPCVDEIVIDTDSESIAEEAMTEFDVTILDRPAGLRGDYVSMNDIILHDVSQIEADVFLQTHCTNPLLRSETIVDAVDTFETAREEGFDSLFSVTPLQTRLWDERTQPVNHERDELQRTQDLTPIYEENSNIFLFTEGSVVNHENRIGDSPKMFPMDAHEAIDIDELIDFKVAEHLHREQYGINPSLSEVRQ